MRYIFILLTAFSFFMTEAQAQKFGHINTQLLLDTLPEYQEAMTLLKAQEEEFAKTLQAQEQDLYNLKAEIEANSAIWNEFLLQQKVKQFDDAAARLQEAGSSAEQALLKYQEELTLPIIEKAREAIQTVGEENGFTYIFDVLTGVILYDGGEDVLPLVLAKINEMTAAEASGNSGTE